MILDCPANVVTLPDGVLACQDELGGSVAWTVQPSFEVSDLVVQDLAGAFGAGFVLVTMFWGLGKGASLVLGMVRR